MGWTSSRIILFFIVSCLLAALPTHAEEVKIIGDRTTFRTTLLNRESYRQKTFRSLKPVYLSFTSRGGVQALVTLHRARARTWTAAIQTATGAVQSDGNDVVLLRGTVRLKGMRYPLAGAVFRDNDNRERLHLYFVQPRKRGSPRFMEVLMSVQDTRARARIRRVPSSALADRDCGASAGLFQGSRNPLNTSSPRTAAASTLKVIELATRYDPLFSAHYGSAANSQIASIVNTANTVYENDLSLSFDLEDTRAHTENASSNALAALTTWRNFDKYTFPTSPSDVYILFTGQDFELPDPNIIGIAYVGTVCQSQEASAGIIQDLNSTLNWLIFAHEVGHTLGGNHTESGIMGASLNPSQNSFSATSQAEIGTYVETEGSCLSTGSSSPTATPTPNSGEQTPTPTPTPTATTRPGGGGGGSGSEPTSDIDLPDLTLATSLTNDGTATVSLARSFEVPSGCQELIMVSTTKSLRNASEIYPENMASSRSYTFTMPGRLVASRRLSPAKRRKLKVYLRYGITCSDSSSQTMSPLRTLNAKKISNSAIPRTTPQTLAALVASEISAGL